MNVEKMTLRVQQALNEANSAAVKYSHQQIDVIHLFYALLEQEDGLIPSIFNKMGVNVKTLEFDTENELKNMPRVTGSGAMEVLSI